MGADTGDNHRLQQRKTACFLISEGTAVTPPWAGLWVQLGAPVACSVQMVAKATGRTGALSPGTAIQYEG